MTEREGIGHEAICVLTETDTGFNGITLGIWLKQAGKNRKQMWNI